MNSMTAPRGRGICRGLLAGLACLGMAFTSAAETPAASNHDIVGTWQGTLHVPQAGKDLRLVVKVEKSDAGALKSSIVSVDQNGAKLPITSTSFADGTLKIVFEMLDGSYEGKLAADGASIAGTWKQGQATFPLVLERATQATEWTIPEPPKKIPPMAADADPSFEVATIKPSKPDSQNKAITVRGTKFLTVNITLDNLIAFAYEVHPKQIVGGPEWTSSDKFDIEAQPDTPGTPNPKQLRTMIKKLLIERFQLSFHQDKRELSAYVLSQSKTGAKLTKNDADAGQLPGLFFQGLGVLSVRNATMQDFADLMQTAVLDRPVVDQTGLAGKWNFLLKWTPDESQFGSMGIKVPPPTDAADAPPPLFTAIQEQIGLKLEAAKTQVPVLVLDKVAKPDAN
jgi:uncharacterized protein (TIGR03435 family)